MQREDFLKRKEKVVETRITYLNNKGQVVDEKKATRAIIREYDKDGNLITEIFGKCNNSMEEER